MFPRDFSYTSLLHVLLFESFLSLRQQGKCCKPTVKFSSHSTTQHAVENERASGTLLPAQTMCGSSKASKNSFLESVTALCSSLLSKNRAKGTTRINLSSWVGYLLDVLTLPLPLQEDRFNPFWGGNALELPTQDIYLAILWCHNCQ